MMIETRSIFTIAVTAIMIMMVVMLIGDCENLMNMKNKIPLLGNEGPLAPVGNETKSNQDFKPIPVTSSGIAGGFAILLMRDTSLEQFSQGLLGDANYLDVRLRGDEWGALFLDVLRCPDTEDIPLLANEKREDWQARYSSKFQQAIPNHPMLGRIYDTLIYVAYKPEEVGLLREECLGVQSMTSNEKALTMLKKLVQACNEASKDQAGLLLVPD